MKIRPIGEVCQIIAGQHIDANLYKSTPHGHPYLTGPADFGTRYPVISKWTEHPKVFASETDILLTVKGAGVGKINFGVNAVIGRQLMAIRPKRDLLDQSYLFHFLKSCEQRVNALAQGATIPGIGKEDVSSLQLPLPPLSEQRRIASILDQAEALRAKRRQALAKLDELARSIFLEMFGDPDAEWVITDIAGVVKASIGSIRTGPFGSQLLHGEFTESGISVLGIDNAVANEFRWSERRYISESKYKQLKRYTVYPGDVLITIMGTCGRCAIVPNNIPTAINTKHLCCITLDQGKCLPIYLHAYFLQHPIAKKYLKQTAKGAIMSGLNMELIKKMPLLVPPIQLQQEFAHRMESIERLKTTQRAALAQLDALFSSLQHRAFRGEL